MPPLAEEVMLFPPQLRKFRVFKRPKIYPQKLSQNAMIDALKEIFALKTKSLWGGRSSSDGSKSTWINSWILHLRTRTGTVIQRIFIADFKSRTRSTTFFDRVHYCFVNVVFLSNWGMFYHWSSKQWMNLGSSRSDRNLWGCESPFGPRK